MNLINDTKFEAPLVVSDSRIDLRVVASVFHDRLGRHRLFAARHGRHFANSPRRSGLDASVTNSLRAPLPLRVSVDSHRTEGVDRANVAGFVKVGGRNVGKSTDARRRKRSRRSTVAAVSVVDLNAMVDDVVAVESTARRLRVGGKRRRVERVGDVVVVA